MQRILRLLGSTANHGCFLTSPFYKCWPDPYFSLPTARTSQMPHLNCSPCTYSRASWHSSVSSPPRGVSARATEDWSILLTTAAHQLLCTGLQKLFLTSMGCSNTQSAWRCCTTVISGREIYLLLGLPSHHLFINSAPLLHQLRSVWLLLLLM